ncbi:MAG TPA: hypothetical protein VFH39_00615 [Candidatus Saccharimonadales bacterium]|nr:hypothetical protein [Candidatus Saccharimonadales bacterium]
MVNRSCAELLFNDDELRQVNRTAARRRTVALALGSVLGFAGTVAALTGLLHASARSLAELSSGSVAPSESPFGHGNDVLLYGGSATVLAGLALAGAADSVRVYSENRQAYGRLRQVAPEDITGMQAPNP